MLHLICALKCEARSLIAHYRLIHCGEAEFYPFYISQDKNISLTISGVGKINAAAATAFTQAFLQTGKQDIWLNIGIAGHNEMAIGEITLAHKVIDLASQQMWYPQFIGPRICHSVTVTSCDKPQTVYTDSSLPDTVFEMEAAGFYATASRFATSELIHVIKVISDNQHQAANNISEAFVVELIAARLDIIDQILNLLGQLSTHLDSLISIPDYYELIIEQWRFTQAQRNMLKSCLHRWRVLCPDKNPMHELDGVLQSKDVIRKITHTLDHMSFNL